VSIGAGSVRANNNALAMKSDLFFICPIELCLSVLIPFVR
jgi:hypothetical protein